MAIRKQYHFWPGTDGLDAWDVDRLIQMSRNLPVHEVEVSSLRDMDSVYWFDDVTLPTVRNVCGLLTAANGPHVSGRWCRPSTQRWAFRRQCDWLKQG